MEEFLNTPFAEFADAIPEDLSALGGNELTGLITDLEETLATVTGSPADYVSAEFTTTQLIETVKLAVETLKTLKAEAAKRVAIDDEAQAALDALRAEGTAAAEVETDDDVVPDADDDDADEDAVLAAALTAAGATDDEKNKVLSDLKHKRNPALPAPSRDREVAAHEAAEQHAIQLTAGGGCRNVDPGTPFESELQLAEAMIKRHETFRGSSEQGGPETFTIARADWKDQYREAGRSIIGHQNDELSNWDAFKSVSSPAAIQREFAHRRHLEAQGIAASGGLCAPVTPYYNLQYISVPTRPVMASLPSYVADRGGLRYARPAALSAVTTATGIITQAQDAAGGSLATKTCQVIPCPAFQETDVSIIYHCLQFGNLGARTFPELVAQWNNLVLASHARIAESNLLTQIDGFSTQVTAGHFGLGASATLFSQILAAANGLRSRNRMAPDAVLRIMLPWWSVDLIISDVIRTQFERFDTTQAQVTALLRSFNVEPTFYIDGANGRSQVFGTQSAGSLLQFPNTVVWYLFPEASFLYLDAGTLELGIVRDSVLNKTNDFQIFGESFENVAFVGVESLAVVTTVCDSGTVSLPTSVTCPIAY